MSIIYWILLVICLLIIVAVGAIQLSNLFALLRTRGVPYVPLFKYQLRKIEKHVFFPDKSVKVVDLGSGDGRVLRFFEKLGIKDVTGYEINWWAYVKCLWLNKLKHSRCQVFLKNFEHIDLSQFDIVFCYLLDTALKSLRPKFEQELKPGTRIISYMFQIPDWHEPDQIIITNDKHPGRDRIYIYDIK